MWGPATRWQGHLPTTDGMGRNKEGLFSPIGKGGEDEFPGEGSIGKKKGSIKSKGPVGADIEEADQFDLHTDQRSMEEKPENTAVKTMPPDGTGRYVLIIGLLKPEGFPVIAGRDFRLKR